MLILSRIIQEYVSSGCNPKVKNLEGLIPKKIADQSKAKDAKKNMRKAEKGFNDMTANLRPGRSFSIDH